MELDGEEIFKRGIKTPIWVVILNLIGIIAIIGSIVSMEYRKKTETPEPVDFAYYEMQFMDEETGEIKEDERLENTYAYFSIEGLTSEVAIYGDTENPESSSNDKYYIAINGGYWYIVDLDSSTLKQLDEIQKYTYGQLEEGVVPELITIYGMTEKIPYELKQYVLNYYNDGLEEEAQIKYEDFEKYFGGILLNTKKSPVDVEFEIIGIVLGGMLLFFGICSYLYIYSFTKKTMKYLKKNGYEEEVKQQLYNMVEEAHYKNKFIITKDFIVNKDEGFRIVKFSDIKWVHIHELKYYGTTTISNYVVYLRDGKTRLELLKHNGAPSDEFMAIFDKICQKVPEDCLKGFTTDNQKAYKEYKKNLKNG